MFFSIFFVRPKKEPGYFHIDHADEAVRGMLVLEHGALTWPPPEKKVTKKTPEKKEEIKTPAVIDYAAPYIAGAKNATMLSSSMLALGVLSPNLAFSNMTTVFCLSNIIGIQVLFYLFFNVYMYCLFVLFQLIFSLFSAKPTQQAVLGVTHALHSPLMAVTNAISGTTALGGIHLLGHVSDSNPSAVWALGGTATLVSSFHMDIYYCPINFK